MNDRAIEALAAEASALRQAGRVEEAIAAYEELLALKPNLAESWYNLGWLQRQARRFEDALASYGEALARGVSAPEEVHLNRAVILSDHLARFDDAEAELDKALALNPDYSPALVNLGNLAEDKGNREAAAAAYERALASDPENMLALARLAGVVDATSNPQIIARLRDALGKTELGPGDRADLGFALGRLLDADGAYDEAFETYAAANRASRASLGPSFRGYDAQSHKRFVDRLIQVFDRPSDAHAPTPDGAPPIFICGMFRSGSTLTETMLAGHSRVSAGGELDFIPSLLRSVLSPYPEAAADPDAIARARDAYMAGLNSIRPSGKIITDKRPDNFLHIGLIKAMFPDAKIVHTHRAPLDNILSLYFLHLHPSMAYALDLKSAAQWYREYRRLMAHWKAHFADDIFDVDYDALVTNPRPATEALLTFCGLDWEEPCLTPNQAPGIVKTASVWQVREPLHQRSSGRWRNYKHYLGDLEEALGQLRRP